MLDILSIWRGKPKSAMFDTLSILGDKLKETISSFQRGAGKTYRRQVPRVEQTDQNVKLC